MPRWPPKLATAVGFDEDAVLAGIQEESTKDRLVR